MTNSLFTLEVSNFHFYAREYKALLEKVKYIFYDKVKCCQFSQYLSGDFDVDYIVTQSASLPRSPDQALDQTSVPATIPSPLPGLSAFEQYFFCIIHSFNKYSLSNCYL